MIRKIVITIGLVLTIGFAATAQQVALKHNLAYDAILTPNLSLEFAMGKKLTLDTQVGWNAFIFNLDVAESNYSETKWAHWRRSLSFATGSAMSSMVGSSVCTDM